MLYRGSYGHSRPTAPLVPLWRLSLVIGTFWLLAVVVFAISQWIMPALYANTPTTTPSGINYGTVFASPFIKTWGLWISGFLVVLGPAMAAWRALERGGEAAIGKALGTTGNRRGRQ